jgi:hypothetical protein
MPSLSSLIVQRQVATIAEVEQAIARQVIHGGDFLTNLLEVAPHAERAVAPVLAESLALPSAGVGRLPPPDNEALALLPMDLALRAVVFPLRMQNEMLVLATSDVLRPMMEEDILDAVRVRIALAAAPLIRIREGIAAHYGAPLDARQLRLIDLLDAVLRSEAPPAPVPAPIATMGDLHFPTGLKSGVSERPPPVDVAPPTRRRMTAEILALRVASVTVPDPGPSPRPPSSPADVAVDAPAAPAAEADPELDGGRPTWTSDDPPSAPLADVPVVDSSPRPPGMVDRKAALSLLRREAGGRASRAKTARRKGPYSRAEAERDLESARAPDDILDTFFAFGSQFFEYAALFVVHGDLLEGRDAWGPGASHLRVLGLGVPLDLPSSLSQARKSGQVLLSRFDEHEIDREFRRDLERAPRRASLAALIPVTIRGRAVGLLYGDDGDNDVTLGTLGDLLGFCALASANVERLLRAKKGKVGPSPRAQPHSVAALARALDLPVALGGAHTSAAPPMLGRLEPRVSPGAASVLPPAPRTTHEPPTELEAPIDAGASEPPPSVDAAGPMTIRATPGSGSPPASRDEAPAAARSAREETPAPAAPSAASDPSATSDDPLLASLAGRVDPLAQTATALSVLRSERPAFDEQSALESADLRWKPPRHPFVPPIPREEDDDVSEVVAAQSQPMREAAEPDMSEGRVGSYHLVPRPAETRRRGDSHDLDVLLHRALVGGLEGEEALGELLALPDVEIPKLLARFPGPLTVDRLRFRAEIPPASECGPLLKVVGTLRRTALPFVTVRSASPDLEQRFWATHILGELLYPEASSAVLPRLFDDDVAVRRVARRAAQALVSAGPAGEPLSHALDDTMRNPEEPMHRRLLAIEALVDLRVAAVVPILIGGLRDPSDSIVEAARTGLIVVTRQDLGRHFDVWDTWYAAHKGMHRIEWLIDALTHDTHSIRRAAGEELKLITREYFGYYDDLPARERERAQQRYRQWWTEDGQYRFR